MKRNPEDERRSSLPGARKDDELGKQTNRIRMLKEKRLLAIKNAKRHWESMQNDLVLKTSPSLLEVRNSTLLDVNNAPSMLEVRPSTSGSYKFGSEKRLSPDTSRRFEAAPNVQGDKSDGEGGQDAPVPDVTFTLSRPSTPRRRPASSRLVSQNSLCLPDQTEASRHQPLRPSSSREGGNKNRTRLEDTRRSQSTDQQDKDLAHLAEVHGDQLKLYGPGSLEFFDRPIGASVAAQICTISFSFVDIDEITKHLYKIRSRFPNTLSLNFTSTNICSLAQLNSLSALRKLDSIFISEQGNPVTQLRLWREYLMFRLAHFPIKRINGHECFTPDVVKASELFEPIARATSELIPTSRLTCLADESKKKYVHAYFEGRTDKSVTDVVGKIGLSYHQPDVEKSAEEIQKSEISKAMITNLSQVASSTCKQLQEFYVFWPELLYEMTYSAVEEMMDTKRYEKRCWDEFMSGGSG